MPRYRFDWRNVDPDLLAALTVGQAVSDDEPAEWMRRTFGARPRERFVAEMWPVLREEWLASADGPRRAVVEALRSWSLGDSSIEVHDAAGQLDYLRSCRNQVTLRRAVLDQFIQLGERPAGPLKRSGGPTSTWADFEGRLITGLEALAPGQFLILSVRGTGTGRGEEGEHGSAYFVQFAQGGEEGFRAEAVSDAYLVGRDKLSREQLAALVQLGWHLPTYAPGDERGDRDPHGSPNWFHDWDDPPAPFDEVAALAVATLRDAFSAESPDHLEYQAFDGTGEALDLSVLGIGRQAPPPGPKVPAGESLPRPGNQEELRQHVEDTLCEFLDVEEMEPDGDGDYVVNAGSTVVYVRALSEVPVVRLFSPILTNVVSSPSLLEAANEISRQYSLLRAVTEGDTITLVADVLALPYVSEHISQALTVMTHFADELDDQLQQRFGGQTLLGAGPSNLSREGNAGYL